MKFTKVLKTAVAVLLIFTLGCLPTVALDYDEPVPDEPAEPLEYAFSERTALSITSTGYATVEAEFTGNPTTFYSVQIDMKIQKKFLFIWINVSGADWTIITHEKSGDFIRHINLTDSGQYRVQTKFSYTGLDSGTEQSTLYSYYDY